MDTASSIASIKAQSGMTDRFCGTRLDNAHPVPSNRWPIPKSVTD